MNLTFGDSEALNEGAYEPLDIRRHALVSIGCGSIASIATLVMVHDLLAAGAALFGVAFLVCMIIAVRQPVIEAEVFSPSGFQFWRNGTLECEFGWDDVIELETKLNDGLDYIQITVDFSGISRRIDRPQKFPSMEVRNPVLFFLPGVGHEERVAAMKEPMAVDPRLWKRGYWTRTKYRKYSEGE